jgi:hypothetical protein
LLVVTVPFRRTLIEYLGVAWCKLIKYGNLKRRRVFQGRLHPICPTELHCLHAILYTSLRLINYSSDAPGLNGAHDSRGPNDTQC